MFCEHYILFIRVREQADDPTNQPERDNVSIVVAEVVEVAVN